MTNFLHKPTITGIETEPPPLPPIDLPTNLYHHLVHTLTALLPPPLDDSPEALHARNHAAIAKVAALLPVNANEADLAAQCIAARAQAEDILRLNAQYGSMVRTSLAVQGRLMRVQAVRQKREAIEGAASQDASTQHAIERLMLKVADPEAEPRQPKEPAPKPAAPDQKTQKNVTQNRTISQTMAFETWMSRQPWNKGDESDLRAAVQQAMAESRERRRKHESPRMAG